jgi:mevalonate pyrophosphate decarboxylase
VAINCFRQLSVIIFTSNSLFILSFLNKYRRKEVVGYKTSKGRNVMSMTTAPPSDKTMVQKNRPAAILPSYP